jgi:hypothetical protein
MSFMHRYRKQLVVAAIGLELISLLLVLAAVFYYQAKQEKLREQLRIEYEMKLQEQKTTQQATRVRVIVASRTIPAGTTLQPGDVKAVEVAADQAAHALKELAQAVGMVSKIDLGPGTPLVASMLFEDQPLARDVRAQEFNVIQLPTNLQKGQFVDVRINFPTGEDFIVLSKKKVRELSGTIVWYEMNETEILMASSAIIDAYLQGARLYALTYVDPGMQEAAVANYPSNPKVLDLMENDPNILQEAKTALARQLRTTLDKNLSAMSDADKLKVMSGSVTVQQQLQNDRITTQQNNAAKQVAQQQTGSVSDPSRQTVSGGQVAVPSPSAAPQPTPVQTPSPKFPKTEATPEPDKPKTDKMQDIFDQSPAGES